MTTQETTSILSAEEKIRIGINDEMMDQNGQVYPYSFTGNLFLIEGRVWHEFKMDDENTLLYGFVDDRGTVTTCIDRDEASDYFA